MAQPSGVDPKAEALRQRRVLNPQPEAVTDDRLRTDEVMEFVGKLREASPDVSAQELARRIEEHFGRSVHPRSVERAIERREKKRRASR